MIKIFLLPPLHVIIILIRRQQSAWFTKYRGKEAEISPARTHNVNNNNNKKTAHAQMYFAYLRLLSMMERKEIYKIILVVFVCVIHRR